MLTLECSSRGDKRYSAFFCWLTVDGVRANIETHYQNCKKFLDKSITNPKGMKPDYIEIRGQMFPLDFAKAYYEILWVKYLDSHQDLVDYAKQFEYFTDMFRSKKSMVCQADVIKEYVKSGRESILEHEKVKILLDTVMKGFIENVG